MNEEKVLTSHPSITTTNDELSCSDSYEIDEDTTATARTLSPISQHDVDDDFDIQLICSFCNNLNNSGGSSNATSTSDGQTKLICICNNRMVTSTNTTTSTIPSIITTSVPNGNNNNNNNELIPIATVLINNRNGNTSPRQALLLPTTTTISTITTTDGGSSFGDGDNLSISIATSTTSVENSINIPVMDSTIIMNTLPLSPNVCNLNGGISGGIDAQQQLPKDSTLPLVVQLKPKFRITEYISRAFLHFKSSGIGEPSVYHALVVIFLEFFAWGLLTMPVISVLNQTFPDHTFLMNGLVMGIKGILSFLSAPLIGALSDIWGRKFFLLITVFFTCAPIPLMTINTFWFFAMISISGVFAVTFSVVFAYVADVTTIEDRSRAYGLVSATFAASLVISPALGATLMEMYSDTLVVALATAIAVLDVFFILVAVPESLPEKVRPSSWGAPISWEQADPFAALRKVGSDHTILMQCVTVFLSYLPEAGQYSCIFVYLKLKMGFNSIEVSIFIAIVGILSILIQITLGFLMKSLGAKRTIIIGLIFEMMQLLWYGFGSQRWMMWAAGILAALGSITYPAISAFVSIHSLADRQGVVQGMVTGMRGLCNGLGPAMFGVIFYLFHVDLNAEHSINKIHSPLDKTIHNETLHSDQYAQFAPGPPFVFGAFMVILAILVAVFIPENPSELSIRKSSVDKKRSSLDVHYEIERGRKVASPLSPLMRSDSSAQL